MPNAPVHWNILQSQGGGGSARGGLVQGGAGKNINSKNAVLICDIHGDCVFDTVRCVIYRLNPAFA